MSRQPLHEDLLDVLSRLVGRPMSVVQPALEEMLKIVVAEADTISRAGLGSYPLTAWAAIAPQHRVVARSWTAMREAGLGTEEVYTALAVIDDHVRRAHGNAAWDNPTAWGAHMLRRYALGADHPPVVGAGPKVPSLDA